MNIRQMSMSYSPEEDRITFRFSTQGGDAFRLLMTRRFVKLLWPILMRLMETEFKSRTPEHAHLAREMIPFEHQQAMAGADLKTQYEEPMERFPLGEAPVLLTGIKTRESVLCLVTASGKGIEFPITQAFLHPISRVIRDVVGRTDWDLPAITGKPSAKKPGGDKPVYH